VDEVLAKIRNLTIRELPNLIQRLAKVCRIVNTGSRAKPQWRLQYSDPSVQTK